MAQTALDAITRVREVKFVTNDEERVDELRSVLQSIAGCSITVERSPSLDTEAGTFWSAGYALHFDPE